MNDGRIVQYLDAMRQLLKYDQVVVQNPSVWTKFLNIYIDNVFKA
ncbi:19553_t:CDS:1, partial [Entrophospora sp. SA101]